VGQGLKLKWTPAASRDLEEIEAYIGQGNPLAALQTVLQLIDQVRNLKDHPGLGRPGRVQRARELMISDTPYIVHYKVQGDEIVILRALHGAMKWPEKL
jgi:toxin ParE1/3/4